MFLFKTLLVAYYLLSEDHCWIMNGKGRGLLLKFSTGAD